MISNIFLITILSIITSCFSDNNEHKNTSKEYRITLYPDSVGKDIPSTMIGFNMSYYHDKEDLWRNGKIATKLKEVKAKLLRYPGGAETGYFHWQYPGCPGYVDVWNSKYLSDKSLDLKQISDNKKNMDVDEYFSWCKKIGAEPLLGINILSGIVDNKIDASLQEAKDLLSYCKSKGYRLKYLFLDNEVDHTGSYTHISIEKYIEMIRLFSPVLKTIDPDIRIIISVIEGASDQKYKTLIDQAGSYFDVIDIHCYYSTGGWGRVEWRKWVNQRPLLSPAGITYTEDFDRLTRYIRKSRYPNIKLSVLEWNIAPSNVEVLSSFQQALMQAEMFRQFVSSSLEMACVWPLIWKVKKGTFPSILDQKNYSPTPLYQVLKLYSEAIGHTLIQSTSTDFGIVQQAMASQNKDSTWVYAINKSDREAPVHLYIKGSANYSKASVCVMQSNDISKDTYRLAKKELTVHKNHAIIILPAYSFSRFLLTKL